MQHCSKMGDVADSELVNDVRDSSCSSCLEKLIGRHTGICYSISGYYASRFPHCLSIQMPEIASHKDYLIWMASKSFNSTLGVKFATYLGNSVRFFCLGQIRKNSPLFSYCPEVLQFTVEKIQEETHQETQQDYSEEAQLIFNFLDELKDKRIKKVFEIRYFCSDKKQRNWESIGNALGVSYQWVLDLHGKGLRHLRRKLNKIGLENGRYIA